MRTTLSAPPVTVGRYRAACDTLDSVRSEELRAGVQAACCSALLAHGFPTEHVILMLHGFTASPAQFSLLGPVLFEQGHNVLIPRMPHHGLQDRVTRATRNLTAGTFIEYGNHALDLAVGLGRRVLVMGISGGGTVACWLAQNRPEVDIAIPIAAMLGMSFIPAWGTRLFSKLLHALPDFYMWWDPRTREANPYALPTTYPGYSTRAMSELLRLGISIERQAAENPSAARRVVFVINDNEPGVSNAELERLYAGWERVGTASLGREHFEKALKLPHDLITPDTPGLDYALVNRRLAALVAAETGVTGNRAGENSAAETKDAVR